MLIARPMAIMAGMRRVFRQARCGTWLTSERALGYATVLLLVELAVAMFFVAGTHGLIVHLPNPTTTDFVSFYAAGQQANAGTPERVYDPAAHYVAEQAATQAGIPYIHFFYPPIFLLICAAFAHLPYLPAFLVFQAATLAPCLLLARTILREPGWHTLVFVLAFPATLWNIGVGQNALLTAALFGTATLLADRRPLVAGLLIGALCYKPQFGLLWPVALVAMGNWRAFATATATALTLIVLSGLLFGWESWTGFLGIAAAAHSTFEHAAVDVASLTSPFGFVVALGGDAWLAYAAQAMATTGAAVAVFTVWSRGASLPIRAAVLAAAMPVGTPMTMFYDLVMSGLALLWLVRAGRDRGFLPWQKLAIFAVFPLPLLSGNIDNGNILVASPAAAAVFGVALYYAWGELRTRIAAAMVVPQ